MISTNRVDLSIIIVNWNTRELLRKCLDSVLAPVADIDYETIVVDNASSDGSCEMVRDEFPSVRLVQNQTNVGFARANNQAINATDARYVLLLNSDAVLLPESVQALIAVLDRESRVAIVGAQLLNADGSFQGSFADFPNFRGELLLATKLARWFLFPSYPNYPAELSQAGRAVDWVSGACLMARRTAIAQVGVLDEAYFMYSEETDWCYRMRRAGWRVYYEPRARVVHLIGQSSNRVPERRRSQVYRSKWLFMRKHRGAVAAAAFRGCLWLASALKLGFWAVRSIQPRSAARGIARQHVRSYRLVLSELAR
jgi:GT2 family glycosyltransferase